MVAPLPMSQGAYLPESPGQFGIAGLVATLRGT
jgi:hypothetical protein